MKVDIENEIRNYTYLLLTLNLCDIIEITQMTLQIILKPFIYLRGL